MTNTPPLLALPPELRLQIYSHVPSLQPRDHDTQILLSSPLTPCLARASRLLRAETLPLYAAHTRFAFEMDGHALARRRVHAWVAALGPCNNLARVRMLHLGRHWACGRPTRGEGHSGFYVRVWRKRADREERWECVGGTYPVARDGRRRRAEMVEELVRFLRVELMRLNCGSRGGGGGEEETEAGNMYWGLGRGDVDLMVRSMDIVALHANLMDIAALDELTLNLHQIRPTGPIS